MGHGDHNSLHIRVWGRRNHSWQAISHNHWDVLFPGGGGGGGTHYMKVTTYAPPFWPPFFMSLENLYCFDPYILAKMRKMSHFNPYFLSKFVAFRVDGQCWASLSETCHVEWNQGSICLMAIKTNHKPQKDQSHMGQVTKVRLSCYLVLLSTDSKTR